MKIIVLNSKGLFYICKNVYQDKKCILQNVMIDIHCRKMNIHRSPQNLKLPEQNVQSRQI